MFDYWERVKPVLVNPETGEIKLDSLVVCPKCNGCGQAFSKLQNRNQIKSISKARIKKGLEKPRCTACNGACSVRFLRWGEIVVDERDAAAILRKKAFEKANKFKGCKRISKNLYMPREGISND